MIRPFTLCCLTVSGFLCGIGVQAQVVLNEVSASNLTATADNFGEFEDWVELFNPTGAAVDISGWYLSDSQNNPLKWQFPPGTMLAANGYQLVYCSGRNTAVAPFHTSFKLNQTQQERIVLSDLNGTLVDVYQLQDPTKTNGSRGRTTDGAATWSLFQTPTPGTSNTGASAEYTARPQLAPAAGFYGGAQAVTMTSPVAGATIRYTLDGTTPTATSTLYAGPVNIAATTVVRAIAFDPNAAVPPSFIETNTYFINANHTVPVISASGDQVTALLNGNGGIQPIGVLEYFSASGQLLDEAVGEFNEHGQDSWAYDQRGVDYVARDQTGYNDGINHPIFRTKSRDRLPARHHQGRCGRQLRVRARTTGAHSRCIRAGPQPSGRPEARRAQLRTLRDVRERTVLGRVRHPREGRRFRFHQLLLRTGRIQHPVPEDLGWHVGGIWRRSSGHRLGCPAELHRHQQHGRPCGLRLRGQPVQLGKSGGLLLPEQLHRRVPIG